MPLPPSRTHHHTRGALRQTNVAQFNQPRGTQVRTCLQRFSQSSHLPSVGGHIGSSDVAASEHVEHAFAAILAVDGHFDPVLVEGAQKQGDDESDARPGGQKDVDRVKCPLRWHSDSSKRCGSTIPCKRMNNLDRHLRFHRKHRRLGFCPRCLTLYGTLEHDVNSQDCVKKCPDEECKNAGKPAHVHDFGDGCCKDSGKTDILYKWRARFRAILPGVECPPWEDVVVAVKSKKPHLVSGVNEFASTVETSSSPVLPTQRSFSGFLEYLRWYISNPKESESQASARNLLSILETNNTQGDYDPDFLTLDASTTPSQHVFSTADSGPETWPTEQFDSLPRNDCPVGCFDHDEESVDVENSSMVDWSPTIDPADPALFSNTGQGPHMD